MKQQLKLTYAFAGVMAVAFWLATAMGCAGVTTPTLGGGGNGGGGPRGIGGFLGGGVGGHMSCTGLCTDFPTDPIIAGTAPTSAPTMFGGTPSGAGPCIMEPEDNSLFPNNWLRPRVSVQGTTGLLQITIHSDLEANDLVAYTDQSHWEMPVDIWHLLANHVVDKPISVTVRGTTGGASTNHFTVASVPANGNMVFWAADPAELDIDITTCRTDPTKCAASSELLGFSVGSETTAPVLVINQVQQIIDNGGTNVPVTCIGCHSATPDSGFVSFVDSYPWRAATASIQGTAAGVTQPSGVPYPTVTTGGMQGLQQPGWGPFSFTKSGGTSQYWQTGQKIAVSSLGLIDPLKPDYSNGPDENDSPHLAWINLEAANQHMHVNSDDSNWTYVSYAPNTGIDSNNAIGIMARDGDPYGAAMPNWSHDGTTVVYTSTNASISSRLNMETANPSPSSTDPTQNATQQNTDNARMPGLTNIFTVPFNGGLGGTATPVNGAATTNYEEYYPAYSPDDQYLVYTRVPAGQVMYANPNAELALVPAAGTTQGAIRLAANNPPACSGKTSPGVNNHWAKWSPEVQTGPLGKYYWLIFSSNRAGLPNGMSSMHNPVEISQLYLAPVVETETGIQSYPAIYLWNQPTDHVNTTPAWESFEIQVVP